MEKDLRSPIVEKTLYNKLSSLETEEVDDMERFRKKLNVLEIKIDDIYNHLLSSKTINPRKGLIDKLNLVSIALLAVGLVVLVIGYVGTDSAMTVASAGISACGLALMFISVYLQSSRKAQE